MRVCLRFPGMKHNLLFTLTTLLVVHTHLPAADGIQINGTVQGGTVTGGSVTGGAVIGGNVTGGNVTGGAVIGGNVTGGSVTGGSVTGGTVTGGSVQGGAVTNGQVSAGTVTAFAEGREIRVSATVAVSVNVNGATAEVKLGAQTLLVEKTKVLLDGKALGHVPAKARRIEVQVDARGMLLVRADGKEVARGKMPQP
jgi:hypothetical protein